MAHPSIGRDTVRKLLKSRIRREKLSHRFESAHQLDGPKILVYPEGRQSMS
jgi:hypothetical protein